MVFDALRARLARFVLFFYSTFDVCNSAVHFLFSTNYDHLELDLLHLNLIHVSIF